MKCIAWGGKDIKPWDVHRGYNVEVVDRVEAVI
jgi:hypothetical protein